MASYDINKGIGKDVEFRGLRAQYLFIFAGGLLGTFLLFVVMYMAGVPTLGCVLTGIVLGTALIWFTFRLNARYGVHGLMKVAAARSFPRRIINRKRISRLLKIKTDIYEKHT